MSDGGVIWHGSPFHRYLQEVGLDDASLTVKPLKHEPLLPSSAAPASETAPAADNAFLATLKGRYARLVGADPDPTEAHLARTARAHGEEYVGIIAQTPLLLEEDLLFILGVDENILRRKQASSQGDSSTPAPLGPAAIATRWDSTIDSLCVFTSAASLIAAPALLLLLSPRGHGASSLVPAFVASSALALSASTAAALYLRLTSRRAACARQRKHTRNCSALRDFIGAHEAEVAALGRSLRLIQEVELISRGFTITAKPGPISRIEGQTETRKCERLREGLRRVLNTNLHVMRTATLALLKEFPLSQSVDYPGSYRSFLEPSQLGLCVSEDPEEIARETGHLSLAYLKTLFNAVNEQRSEFLRRLALVFSEECQSFHDKFTQDGDFMVDEQGTEGEKLQNAVPAHNAELPLHEKLKMPLAMASVMASLLADLTRVATWSERVLEREIRFQRADGSLFGLLQPEGQAGNLRDSDPRARKAPREHPGDPSQALALPHHCITPMDSFTASLSDIGNHVKSVNAALTLCHHELRDLFSAQDEFSRAAQRRRVNEGHAHAKQEVETKDQNNQCETADGREKPLESTPSSGSPPDAPQSQPQLQPLSISQSDSHSHSQPTPQPQPATASLSPLVSEEQFRRAEGVLLKYKSTIPARIALLQDMFGESILRLEFFLQKLNPGYVPSAAEMKRPVANAAPAASSERVEGAVWLQDATEDVSQSKKARSEKFEAYTGRGGGDDSDASESELEGLPEDVRRTRLLQMREKRRLKREQERAEEMARRAAQKQAQQFISELRQVISGIEER